MTPFVRAALSAACAGLAATAHATPPPTSAPASDTAPPTGEPPRGARAVRAADAAQVIAAAPATALDRAREALAAGDPGRAIDAARASLADPEAAADHATASLLADLASAGPPRGDVVGVLLPLTGRYGGVGPMLHDAIARGFRSAGGRGRVVVVDAGETAASAQNALLTLLRTERPGLVVGPLIAEQLPDIAARCEALGVPLLAMTSRADLPDGGRWTFHAWLTAEQQIAALVDHLMGDEGASRFAIVGPDTPYGRGGADAFAAEVTARGGTIVERALYPDDLTDFRALAADVVGRDEMPPPPKPKPGEPPSDVKGPPLLTVDVVFIPDSARRVPLVAAALAFEELALGNFKPHDVPAARLAGLSGWNRPELIASGGPYLVGARFTDVFIPPPPTGYTWRPIDGWSAFVDTFRADAERTPTPMDALAWDVGVLAADAVAPGRTRDAVRAALIDGAPPPTVTAVGAVDPDSRTAHRAIRVISVRPDGFVPILPADAPPEER